MKFKGKITDLRNLVKDINDLRKRAVLTNNDSERAKIESKIETLKLKLQ